jgi:hypothetical protein
MIMGNFADETGNVYGRLTVLERNGSYRNKVKWLCQCICGNKTTIIGSDLRSGNTKSCGCLRKETTSKNYTREKHYDWKGGTRMKPDGYKLTLCKNHPRADQSGYVLDNILVYESLLRNPLPDKAVIHHINGIRDDNRPENLLMFESNSKHLEFHRNIRKGTKL